MMMLLGELGGLYGAIVGIPSLFISYFVQLSFVSAIAQLAPMKKDDDPDSGDEKPEAGSIPQLQDQLIRYEASDDMPPPLSQEDAEALALEASRIKKMPKVPFIKRLCYSRCLCRKDKWIETQKLFFKEFDDKLDIKNIANDQMSFARFTNVFLSEPQKLLLSHQHDQALTQRSIKDGVNSKYKVFKQSKLTPKSPKKRDRAFNRLMNGFTASSDFDKRLLVGIYRSKRKPKKMKVSVKVSSRRTNAASLKREQEVRRRQQQYFMTAVQHHDRQALSDSS